MLAWEGEDLSGRWYYAGDGMGEQVAAGIKWGCSSAGRAPALQAGGQGFEPLHLHWTGKPVGTARLKRAGIAP